MFDMPVIRLSSEPANRLSLSRIVAQSSSEPSDPEYSRSNAWARPMMRRGLLVPGPIDLYIGHGPNEKHEY